MPNVLYFFGKSVKEEELLRKKESIRRELSPCPPHLNKSSIV